MLLVGEVSLASQGHLSPPVCERVCMCVYMCVCARVCVYGGVCMGVCVCGALVPRGTLFGTTAI